MLNCKEKHFLITLGTLVKANLTCLHCLHYQLQINSVNCMESCSRTS